MSATPNVVLYGTGLFGRNLQAVNQSQVTQLQQSGFTTVILWTLHVDQDGSLVYNDAVIVRDGVFADTFNYLPGLLAQLTSTGSVKNVLFCIGSGGVNDFQSIQTLLSTPAGHLTLARNFSALAAALPISGYDFDDESLYDPKVTAQLTEMLCAKNQMIITYCPYEYQHKAWNPALQDVYDNNQEQYPSLGQSVQWWNLQCYSGGGGNSPKAWADALPSGAGITDPKAFIIPGYDGAQSPDSIQAQFAALAKDGLTGGGFIWNSTNIFNGPYPPAAYAQAIIQGLSTPSTGTDISVQPAKHGYAAAAATV